MTNIDYHSYKTWVAMKGRKGIDFNSCPNSFLASGFRLYFEEGIEPGSFGSALLCNDLMKACACADIHNSEILADLVEWMKEVLPACCYGNHEIVRLWLKQGGVKTDDPWQHTYYTSNKYT